MADGEPPETPEIPPKKAAKPKAPPKPKSPPKPKAPTLVTEHPAAGAPAPAPAAAPAPAPAMVVPNDERWLHVVLDIDETMVQYASNADVDRLVPKGDLHEKAKSGNGVFFIRPGLDAFLRFLSTTCKTVNIWTLSDFDYATGVKKMIESRVKGLKISNVWVDTDNDDYGGESKDMKFIWSKIKGANGTNTILVDDALSNVHNRANRNNSILISPFNPLGDMHKGASGKNEREGPYRDLTTDSILSAVAGLIRDVHMNKPYEKVAAIQKATKAELDAALDDSDPDWVKAATAKYNSVKNLKKDAVFQKLNRIMCTCVSQTGKPQDIEVFGDKPLPSMNKKAAAPAAPAAPAVAAVAPTSKKLNIILDIDETIVQHVPTVHWNKVDESERAKYTVIMDENEKGATAFVLRPGFDEFFRGLKDVSATVNLWTWSPKAHAEKIAKIVKDRTGVVIQNKWGEDIAAAANDEYGGSKNLKYIWSELGEFSPEDTILIDELPRNTQNEANKNNGIQLKEFMVLEYPLNEKGKADKSREPRYRPMSDDTTLAHVLDALRRVNVTPGARPVPERMAVDVPLADVRVEKAKAPTKAGRRKTRRKARKGRKTRARKTKTLG
jgi:hypothetical protein